MNAFYWRENAAAAEAAREKEEEEEAAREKEEADAKRVGPTRAEWLAALAAERKVKLVAISQANDGEITRREVIRALGLTPRASYGARFLNRAKRDGAIEPVRYGVYRLA